MTSFIDNLKEINKILNDFNVSPWDVEPVIETLLKKVSSQNKKKDYTYRFIS